MNAATRPLRLAAVLSTLLLAGCVSKLVKPEPIAMPEASLPHISVRQPVDVVPVLQPDAKPLKLCNDYRGGGLVWIENFAHPDDLARLAAASMADILRRNGATVVEGAPRALEISVKGFCSGGAVVVVGVVARGQSRHDFSGKVLGGSERTWLQDNINDALVSALRNRAIRSYLED